MKRILLKLSGEALAGAAGKGLDNATVLGVASQVKKIVDDGTAVGIVIGGGNFWRGDEHVAEIERTKGDQIGMLATVMNCLYVSEVFRKTGLKTRVVTPFIVGTFTGQYSKDTVMEALAGGEVVFFAGGTGHPYFSTDTATVLRAIEIEADGILMAKSVDAVYDKDPAKHPDAVKYESITIDEVVRKGLGVIDQAAAVLCKENKMPLFVFGLNVENSIVSVASGEKEGTVVLPE
ncbi:MAG: UMP kinase [Lachnospiraceae bacterium]|jgi:uridylate kinase